MLSSISPANGSIQLVLTAVIVMMACSAVFGQQSRSPRAPQTNTITESMDKQPPFWSWAEPYHDNNLDRDYEGGEMRIKHRADGSYWSVRALPIMPRSDWSVQINCRIDNAVPTGGLGVHVNTPHYQYFFKIAGSKQAYWVGHYRELDKSWKTYSKSAPDGSGDYPCSCVNPNGQNNTLKVQRLNNIIQFIINDTTVEEFEADDMPEIDTSIYGLGINVSQKVEGGIDDVTITYREQPIRYHKNALKGATKTFMNELDAQQRDRYAVLSPNGQSIYWVRIELVNGDDIYTASRVTDSTWTQPKNIGSPLNNNQPNNVTSVTQDDNELFIWGLYNDDGSWAGSGFSTARRTTTGWKLGKSLPVTNYVNKATSREECVSSDRSVAIFSCERDATEGGKDLYVAFLKDGNYSEPRSLGRLINSAWNEGMPYLAADNKTLYFASGRPGFGNDDIWVTKRLDDSWLNWSPPINMGPTVNTAGWDAYFSIHPSGRYAYLNTTDGYKSGITRLTLPHDTDSKLLLPDPIVLVSGHVYDAKTRKAIGTDIEISDLRNNTRVATALSEPAGGKYSITLQAGKAYGFFAGANGYYPVSENVFIDTLNEYKEIERDLFLQPIVVGAVIRLNNLFFDYDRSDLHPESKGELDRVISLMQQYPKMSVELRGHTDDRGSASYNKKLSEQRALAVLTYLVEKGIVSSRMAAAGYGKTRPLTKGNSEKARQNNRRVELHIKSL